MYDWLIHEKYSKQIAEELSEHWANDLQRAFKKGWEKSRNDNHPDRKDYQYMPVQEDVQDELIKEKYRDFIEQAVKMTDKELREEINKIKIRIGIVCDYCGGSGYDPYPNHSTTHAVCPKCQP